ncbi:head-to-tail adaptor [Gordonia phage Butterball]|uniref:Head-to-tail adaptor n=3 Tax=Montyvirus TaxID=2733196 RepID=A0A2L1IWG3_9CAUD|nr:head-tail adaptor [Gordonia phage Jellybones]AVD99527.1 head-to-tail adaptor [Gordonia phage Boneham]QAY16657.1 head-to-tail adaptor [Gordonia phage FelixAlejandro]QAY16946.1 head-to-tail adaptor [Gordonia phage Butterball]QGH76162.1 head-to-tail adaptor [Gordonia phage Jellybones]
MPANRPVYCTTASIQTHVQNIKLPPGATWESLAETASNEVDSNLGVRYVTPFQVSPSDPAQRAAAYWLQNVTSMIAAARLMLSISAPGSQDNANSYGQYLLQNATRLMNDVISGKVDLVGVEEIGANDSVIQGPTILNEDAFSQVDVFYDNFAPEGIMPGLRPREKGTPWPR